MNGFEYDKLIVGLDASVNGDRPILTVFRGEDNKVLRIANIFFGDEALELYHKLVGSLPNGQTLEDVINDLKASVEVKEK